MRIRDEDVEKLLNSLKIEEVVGEVVSLKRSGANYKGLCPFHSDTSPSFTVSPQKNIAKCLRARVNRYSYKRTILQTIDSIEQYVDYMQISRSTSEYLRKHIITQQLFKHQIL